LTIVGWLDLLRQSEGDVIDTLALLERSAQLQKERVVAILQIETHVPRLFGHALEPELLLVAPIGRSQVCAREHFVATAESVDDCAQGRIALE